MAPILVQLKPEKFISSSTLPRPLKDVLLDEMLHGRWVKNGEIRFLVPGGEHPKFVISEGKITKHCASRVSHQ